MLSITNQLNPSKEYCFQTSPSGRTHPLSVKQFLNSHHAKEEIISIDDGIGAESNRLWSFYDGWDVEAYKKEVKRFIALIDKSQEVSNEFIDSAFHDKLTVNQAVNTWFSGTELAVEIEHHAEGTSGLLDITIEGINTVRRVVLAADIKKRDMFNIYYGESSKGGGTWKTDLVTTIKNYFLNNLH